MVLRSQVHGWIIKLLTGMEKQHLRTEISMKVNGLHKEDMEMVHLLGEMVQYTLVSLKIMRGMALGN